MREGSLLEEVWGSLLEQFPRSLLIAGDGFFPFQLKMSDLGLKHFIFLNLNFLLGVFGGSLASLDRNLRPGGFPEDGIIPDATFLDFVFLRP